MKKKNLPKRMLHNNKEGFIIAFLRRRKEGFTLIELVVGMAIFGILIGALLTFQQVTYQSQTQLVQTYQNIDDANVIVNSIAKELREAKQADDGGFMLEQTDDQNLVFYADIDNDGITERVRYTLIGTNLVKGVTKPSGTPLDYKTTNESVATISAIIRNGTQPLFYYYNDSWPQDTINNPLPAANRLANAKLIKISFIVNTDPTKPQQNYATETYVQIRNLKSNI